MSYLGTREQAKSDALAADLQIDGLSPSSTSPVRDGGSSAGMAPMSGESTFTKSRTRPPFVGNSGSTVRREFPTEGVSKKG
jgi:hypothetical protein